MTAGQLVTRLLETEDESPDTFLARNLNQFADDYIITGWKKVAPGQLYPNGRPIVSTQAFLGDTQGPYKLGVGAWYPFNMGHTYTVPKNADRFTYEKAQAYIRKLLADQSTRDNYERIAPRPVNVASQDVTGAY